MIAGKKITPAPSNATYDVIVAPAASTRRVMSWLSAFNPVGNGAIDVELRIYDGSNSARVHKQTIADGATMIVSARAEDAAVQIGGADIVTAIKKVVLDDVSSKLQAVIGSVPITPIEILAIWGDFQ